MDTIVLIYPSLKGVDASNVILPLSLIYVATPLKNQFKTIIIDQRVDCEWRRRLEKVLRSGNVICTGISSMTGPQISGALEAASIIRKITPSVPIVWGGVHPSLTPEQTIKNDLVDIIVIGDGEQTFKELVEVIQKGSEKKNVKGIIYNDGQSIIRTPSRKQFPINRIDLPAYDLIDIEKYNFMPPWTQRKSLPVVTSRGCPYGCTYCYNTEFSHHKWSSLSARQTISQIIALVKMYNIGGIFLLDDNFFVNLKRARQICELIAEKNLELHIYNANCRVDTLATMGDDFLQLLKKVGFNQLYIGVESGSTRVLEKIKKDITIEQVLNINARLKRIGIKPFYSFMAGFPFETVADIKKTVGLMNRLLTENSDAIVHKLQIYTPYPGTELFKYSRMRGMKFPNSLDGWATYHYDKINYNGFDADHKNFLQDMNFYTVFLDSKLPDGLSKYFGFASHLYSKILSFRINHEYYSGLFELYPLKTLQKIRHRR